MSQSSRYSVKPNQPGVLGQKLGVLGLQHLGLRLLGQHGLLRLRAGSRSGPLLAGPHMNGPGPGVQQGGPRPKCRWSPGGGAEAPMPPPPPLEEVASSAPPPEPLSRLLRRDLEEPPEPPDPPREREPDLGAGAGAGGREAVGAEATRAVEGAVARLAAVNSRRRSFLTSRKEGNDRPRWRCIPRAA